MSNKGGGTSFLPNYGRVDVRQIFGSGPAHHDLKLFGHVFNDVSGSGPALFSFNNSKSYSRKLMGMRILTRKKKVCRFSRRTCRIRRLGRIRWEEVCEKKNRRVYFVVPTVLSSRSETPVLSREQACQYSEPAFQKRVLCFPVYLPCILF